jgi:hypothetical protein
MIQFPLTFEPKIDIGHFLTFLTLASGFCWWLYSSIRGWREKENTEARSGALRLLLRLLRERQQEPITLNDLQDLFCRSEYAYLRKAYCGRDYKFKSKAEFETAIYRLDYEGKIDFVTSHSIVFRVDGCHNTANAFVPSQDDANRAIELLKKVLVDSDASDWDKKDMVETCLKLSPAETHKVLHESINSSDDRLAISTLRSIRNSIHTNA